MTDGVQARDRTFLEDVSTKGAVGVDLGPVLAPVKDIGAFIRDQRTIAQISLRGLAAKAGVSNPYLSQVERGLRRPSADILAQIARGLSISVESLLAKAGILETADAPDVVVAICADQVLTERQKSSLIDIYSAFRTEAIRTEVIRTEVIRTEVIRTEVIRTEVIRTEAIRTDEFGPEAIRTEAFSTAADATTGDRVVGTAIKPRVPSSMM